jgi:peptidyl-dipeptidase Dcp
LPEVTDTLLVPWTGPYGGTPPFDRATPESIAHAYETAVELKRREIGVIAANAEAPSFENTIVALENAGCELRRVDCLYRVHSATLNTEVMRRIEPRIATLLPALEDEIAHDEALFVRVSQVRDTACAAGLSSQERRLLDVTYDRFRRRGAGLPYQVKRRLRSIHTRLAGLYAAFGQHLLIEQENEMVILESEADLEGLSASARQLAGTSARKRGLPGKWVISNDRAAALPFLTQSTCRELREKVWRMWTTRGENGGPTDNRALVAEILRLRGEQATLLGFPSYAHWALIDRMAATPEKAMVLLTRVWNRALGLAREQLTHLQALADQEGSRFRIAPWDRLHYLEKLRRTRFDLDEERVMTHLELGNLCQAAFWAAGQLHALAFTEISGVPVPHSDVRVIEVRRAGAPVGVIWLDLFARPGKRPGGWMMEYRNGETFRGRCLPLVSINMNLLRPAADSPVLLTWEYAAILFHELGHALHALSSEVPYPSLAWNQVAWDFVELPSRLNERWLETQEVLERFALDAHTGQPLPAALAQNIGRTRTFDRTAILQYLASAIVDLRIHLQADGREIDPIALEAEVLADIGMPAEITPAHRVPHFAHCFGEDRYAAGYYSYLWADAMAADAAESFTESPGGFYDIATAARWRQAVLSVGNAVLAEDAFRNFRGRDLEPDALLRRLDLAGADSAGMQA